jgi:hypothetical protein
MWRNPEGYLPLVGKGKFRRLLLIRPTEDEIGRMECRLIRRMEAEGEIVSVESDCGSTTVIARGEGESCSSVLPQVKGRGGTIFKTPYLLWLGVEASAARVDALSSVGLYSFVRLGLGLALGHVAGTVYGLQHVYVKRM